MSSTATKEDPTLKNQEIPDPTSQHAAPGDEQTFRDVLAGATAMVPRLRERAAHMEELGRVSEETIAELDGIGVFKMAVPVEYGGSALTPLQQHAIVSEISRGCASTGWVVWVTVTAQQWLDLFDHRFQDEVFTVDWTGPLNSGAGGGTGGGGVARRVEGGYMLSGRWGFNSACHYSAFHHLAATCPEAPEQGVILLQVPHEQVAILDDWKVLGMRGSGSNTVTLENEVFVPSYRVRSMGELFAGVRLAPPRQGVLWKVNMAPHTASQMSAIAVGLARAAVELFQAKIHSRTIPYTSYAKQSDAPITHTQLAELHCKLRTVELLAQSNVELVEQFAQSGSPITAREFSRARLETAYACVVAAEVVALAFRASGASSVRNDSPLQRLLRDSQVLITHAANQIDASKEDFGRAVALETAPS